MIRLNVLVEGQTELNFVKEILAEHLTGFGVVVLPRMVETSRTKRKTYRGGLSNFDKAFRDLARWIQEDKKASWFTTMFDLYALPNSFPDYAIASKQADPLKRVTTLEAAFGKKVNSHKFVPYIQLYEFETLIFADPQALSLEYLDRKNEIGQLAELAKRMEPETINNNRDTSPSHRITKLIGEYDKATSGVSVVKQIGIPKIREKCPHFNEWLKRLESLKP